MFVRRFLCSVVFIVGLCFMSSSIIFAQEASSTASGEEALANKAVSSTEAAAPEAMAPDVKDMGMSPNETSAAEPLMSKVPESSSVVSEASEPPATVMNAEKTEEKSTSLKEESPKAGEKSSEWLWGEVVSVDPANKQVVIKHMDYETYEEVKTAMTIDEKTLFENASGLSEIKAGDHVTVDYKGTNGSTIADLIVVEKGTDSASQPDQTTSQASVSVETKPETTIMSSGNAPGVGAVSEVQQQPSSMPANAENAPAAVSVTTPSGNITPAAGPAITASGPTINASTSQAVQPPAMPANATAGSSSDVGNNQ